MEESREGVHPQQGAIPALLPCGAGHQFVCYADACSGVALAPHAATFAAVNDIVARLRPQPEFVCFPGDEVAGLTQDDEALRQQWRHWLGREMAWLDRAATPLYHTTGNHTTYDRASEAIFREMLPQLPRNGPSGQEGLAYWVRRGDLLLIFANTCWSGRGGEGRVETAWLDATLMAHADARYKLVLGHHPVYPVNGFAGSFQREIVPEDGRAFWRCLVAHGVQAYLCSHILAFDAQVHEGVVQITTAGAGTAHRMPEGVEYLHCVQLAIDASGLRYQVLDTGGRAREWLAWPPVLPPSDGWKAFAPEHPDSDSIDERDGDVRMAAWRLSGICARSGEGDPQTLVAGWDTDAAPPSVWMGLTGAENRIMVLLAPTPGRSPHRWLGPALAPDEPFDLQVALHAGMGPGGVLWRQGDAVPWSSMAAASPWGAAEVAWPVRWSVGHSKRGRSDESFRGVGLRVSTHTIHYHFSDLLG